MNNLRELTLRGTILGALITIIFTASNVYLGLKVGLTFSSAIPAAVISMAVLRLFSGSTILENNMVQTQASAAGTLSSIIFVLPGLLMIGYWQDFPFWLTFAICAAGGMLGVLFSIPLRHIMVVKSTLPYPEGVAAAEILKAGSKTEGDDSNAGLKDILVGGVIASGVSLFTNGFRVLSESASYWFTGGKSIFQLPMGFSLALLSAGYLIGIISGIAVLIGTIIGWVFGIPILSAMTDYDTSESLANVAMGLWAKDIRFIGAGTIAIAAIWTLLTLIKPVIEGLKISFRTLRADVSVDDIAPTERDLSPKAIFSIMAGMVVILVATFYAFISDSGLSAGVAWMLVICAVLFAFIMGFLVAAACGYMAGLVGSSASPMSGIAIVAAIAISLILLVIGQANDLLSTPEGTNFATALALFTTSTVLAVACISNDNLQDLKTGYLVNATPWKQQVALLIGCVVGAIVIAPILEILYNAYGFTGALPRADMDQSQVLAAPQATLMTTIAKGIFSHQLDWTMILIGLAVGSIIIIIDLILAKNQSKFRLPALAVGLGIYLPPTITTPIFIGTLLSWIIKRKAYAKAKKANLDPEEQFKNVDRKAALIASGLIVGESLVGVLLAIVIVISITSGGSDAPLAISADLGLLPQYLGLAVFVIICLYFIRRALTAIKKS
ncbi:MULTISPECIES: OPT family oligopeptide transporter [unclassified Gilliamella]|uniref:OPT family oligopeptide transporter n=1 Tax=unclassified Gilliamella TaxID=2685620 RepID=UPI00226AB936|nr:MULTISPECIES: oligopeptide transporter, OPT family [unclassified Gilliamella]MCX8602329.1 oligopeptide transporter, OPT family [Gilliamella sp. B3722]MCX8608502.1 oligopeptide transporter, OPT family [Gilliamella sp. B3771]MCX8610312.1 oligopeptide transporter, OPT family [Gilliamella sp. B3891]MCX8613020.1 oligopeptide transporter, OPT family [Gilliamella sp. B3773]MCX8616489.1 oligopeptide transporter, OPT family [Gilliamella sp. B3770]